LRNKDSNDWGHPVKRSQGQKPVRTILVVGGGLLIGFILVLNLLDRSSKDGATGSEDRPVETKSAPVTPDRKPQARGDIAGKQQSDEDLINSEAAASIREQYADTVERQMLAQGYDMTVRAEGTRKTTLRLQWVGMSRPVIYGYINDREVVRTLKAMGFKRVVFTDGFESTWRYEVDKLP
jgi:hypothetical protein